MTDFPNSTNLPLPALGAIHTRKGLAMTEELDYRAILRRVEQIVDLLRTCHVCDGWRLDEEGAERTLSAVRPEPSSASEPEPRRARLLA
jgi:hypothetical protein